MAKTESGKFKITNVGTAPRIVYDPDRRAVTVLPGRSVVVFLSERQERDLRRSKTLLLESSSADVTRQTVEAALNQRPQPPAAADEETGGEEDKVYTASELVELAADEDSMSYHELLRHSKVTLGDDFPTGRAGGQPRKTELVKALKAKAKEE